MKSEKMKCVLNGKLGIKVDEDESWMAGQVEWEERKRELVK